MDIDSINIGHISYHYKNNKDFRFEVKNLEFASGETIAIIGENGSEKLHF